MTSYLTAPERPPMQGALRIALSSQRPRIDRMAAGFCCLEITTANSGRSDPPEARAEII